MQHSHTPLILIWMRYCLIHSFSICDSLQQKILELYYIYIWTTKVYCILIVVCNWLPNTQFDYLILDIVLLYLVRTWIWYYLRTHLSKNVNLVYYGRIWIWFTMAECEFDTCYACICESEKMSEEWNEHSYLRYL